MGQALAVRSDFTSKAVRRLAIVGPERAHDRATFTTSAWTGGNCWGSSTMGGATYLGDYDNVGTIVFSNNIVANSQSSTATGIQVASGFTGTTIANIVFNWADPIYDYGAGTIQTQLAATTILVGLAEPFPAYPAIGKNPKNLTIESCYASI